MDSENSYQNIPGAKDGIGDQTAEYRLFGGL
jgi:hypothetical protein